VAPNKSFVVRRTCDARKVALEHCLGHAGRRLDLGFQNVRLRRIICDIASTTCRVKALPTVLTPMIAVGLSDSIVATKSLVGTCECA